MITGTVEFKLDLFDEISARSTRALSEMLAAAVNEGLEVMNQHTPVLTGHLKSRNQVIKMSASFYKLLNDADYAAWVNFGTRHRAANPFFTVGTDAAARALLEKARSFESRLK